MMLLIFISGLFLGFLLGFTTMVLLAKAGLQSREEELYQALGFNSEMGLLVREPSD